MLKQKSKYDKAKHKVELTDVVRANQLYVAVWSRLGGFQWQYERDMTFLYFAVTFLDPQSTDDTHMGNLHGALKEKAHVAWGKSEAPLRKLLGTASTNHAGDERTLDYSAKLLDRALGERGKKKQRNNLAHPNFYHDSYQPPGKQGAQNFPTLQMMINETRDLMCYDRKLRNAVAKSIMDLFAQENMMLKLKAEKGAHKLTHIEVTSSTITHLDGLQLPATDGKGKKLEKAERVKEYLHSAFFIGIIQKLMGGAEKPPSSRSQGTPHDRRKNTPKKHQPQRKERKPQRNHNPSSTREHR